jgi:hypothetical protein
MSTVTCTKSAPTNDSPLPLGREVSGRCAIGFGVTVAAAMLWLVAEFPLTAGTVSVISRTAGNGMDSAVWELMANGVDVSTIDDSIVGSGFVEFESSPRYPHASASTRN